MARLPTLLLLLSAITSASASGTFNVLDYGAKGDGKTLDTLAIRAALAAAGAAGGGTVLFPYSYTFLTGGSLNISAHSIIQVDGRIQGVLDSTDYVLGAYLPWMGPDAQVASQPDQREWQPFLTSWMQDNITIQGSGVIDMGGTADGWWGCASDVTKAPCNGHPRPHGIRLVGGAGHTIRDVTVQNSPMWTIHISYATGVYIGNATVLAPSTSHNTDGIDIDCSQDVLIEDSYISNGDDCVCMKSGLNWYGRTFGRPTANVVVRRMTLGTGHGITVGSEMSAGVYNVTFEDIVADGIGTGVRLKSERGRGGEIRDILYRNITLSNVQGQAVQVTLNYASGLAPTNASATPTMTNVRVQDVTSLSSQYGFFIDGLPESPITNLTLVNVTILEASKSVFERCDNATGTCSGVEPGCPPCLSG